MSRSSCPRKLENKLNREVHHICPICGGIPLVRAHTTKVYSEVGWNYDYLLAICVECEKKVEKGLIDRNLLQNLKNNLKLSISEDNRNTPFRISPIINNNIYLGSNLISSTDIIFSYRNLPIIWLENIDNTKTINARFYDFKGTVVTAIDKNMWTADRDRFYDIKVEKIDSFIKIEVIGKKDDTQISMDISEKGIIFNDSKFYIPSNIIKISEGVLSFGNVIMENCSVENCRAAFNFQ